VVGLKLQLKSGFGFAKPGMPADGEVLVSGILGRKSGGDDRCSPGRATEDHQDVAEQPSIDVRGLSKHYGAVEAIRGITFEVARGEIFGLIGRMEQERLPRFRFLRV